MVALVEEEVEVFEITIDGEGLVIVSLPREPCALPEGLLTGAEWAVAREAAGGASNGDIARSRGCSVRTVANQLASIYRKLGIASRAELAARLFLGPESR